MSYVQFPTHEEPERVLVRKPVRAWLTARRHYHGFSYQSLGWNELVVCHYDWLLLRVMKRLGIRRFGMTHRGPREETG